MRKIILNVTQNDIDAAIARKKNGAPRYDIVRCCPVARALSRHFKGCGANICYLTLKYNNSFNPLVTVDIRDTIVSKFIDTFDNLNLRNTCKPFKFTIEVPDNV